MRSWTPTPIILTQSSSAYADHESKQADLAALPGMEAAALRAAGATAHDRSPMYAIARTPAGSLDRKCLAVQEPLHLGSEMPLQLRYRQPLLTVAALCLSVAILLFL